MISSILKFISCQEIATYNLFLIDEKRNSSFINDEQLLWKFACIEKLYFYSDPAWFRTGTFITEIVDKKWITNLFYIFFMLKVQFLMLKEIDSNNPHVKVNLTVFLTRQKLRCLPEIFSFSNIWRKYNICCLPDHYWRSQMSDTLLVAAHVLRSPRKKLKKNYQSGSIKIRKEHLSLYSQIWASNKTTL